MSAWRTCCCRRRLPPAPGWRRRIELLLLRCRGESLRCWRRSACHPPDLQIGSFLAQLRLVRVERHWKSRIDDVEHVALVNVLVVNDPDFGDLPDNLGTMLAT